jgi:hypothetical protein
MDYTPAVLRNRGVPAEFYALEETEEGTPFLPEITGNQKRAKETRFVRFDFNTIADIETLFGDTEKWQESMAQSPATAIRRTLALSFGANADDPDGLKRAERAVGLSLIEGKILEYGSAISVAWGLANGLDPTKAVEALEQAKAKMAELAAEMEAALVAETDAEADDSPGDNS